MARAQYSRAGIPPDLSWLKEGIAVIPFEDTGLECWLGRAKDSAEPDAIFDTHTHMPACKFKLALVWRMKLNINFLPTAALMGAQLRARMQSFTERAFTLSISTWW